MDTNDRTQKQLNAMFLKTYASDLAGQYQRDPENTMRLALDRARIALQMSHRDLADLVSDDEPETPARVPAKKPAKEEADFIPRGMLRDKTGVLRRPQNLQESVDVTVRDLAGAGGRVVM